MQQRKPSAWRNPSTIVSIILAVALVAQGVRTREYQNLMYKIDSVHPGNPPTMLTEEEFDSIIHDSISARAKYSKDSTH